MNRGGFCGPLGTFDTAAIPGWLLYNIDITSLYPACCRLIQYLARIINDLGEEEDEEQTKGPPETYWKIWLKGCAENDGKVDTHSKLGQKFRNIVKASEDWQSRNNQYGKQSFMKKRSRDQYDSTQAKKQREQGEKSSVLEKGTYEPLDMIIGALRM